MFRISQGLKKVVHVDDVDQIEPAVRALGTGRWVVDQIEHDPLPSGHTSRRCGAWIKLPDGSVVPERDPWKT
jgi:hypothetical protein